MTNNQSGKAAIVLLSAVAITAIALGAFAYFSGHITGQTKGEEEQASLPLATAQSTQPEIKPGNPIVARVNGKDITRMDVIKYAQELPAQAQQMPLEQLFPLAQEQVINAQIVTAKTQEIDLSNDPEVQRQLAIAKKQIERNVYLENAINEKITDTRIEEAYKTYTENFTPEEEARAAHILVKEKEQAEALLTQIQEGADFATLAAEHSTDSGNAPFGGDLGYFTKDDMVAPFAQAVFAAPPQHFG